MSVLVMFAFALLALSSAAQGNTPWTIVGVGGVVVVMLGEVATYLREGKP